MTEEPAAQTVETADSSSTRSRERGRGASDGTPYPLTFSSVCTNCSTGMEPLSRGFKTLQSGMSSLARFLFLPPVGWAGLGGGWVGGKQGSISEPWMKRR